MEMLNRDEAVWADQLLPAEKLLWTGRPTPDKLFESKSARRLLYSRAALVVGMLFVGAAIESAVSNAMLVASPVTSVAVVLVCVFLAVIGPLKRSRHHHYAITNQRVLWMYDPARKFIESGSASVDLEGRPVNQRPLRRQPMTLLSVPLSFLPARQAHTSSQGLTTIRFCDVRFDDLDIRPFQRGWGAAFERLENGSEAVRLLDELDGATEPHRGNGKPEALSDALEEGERELWSGAPERGLRYDSRLWPFHAFGMVFSLIGFGMIAALAVSDEPRVAFAGVPFALVGVLAMGGYTFIGAWSRATERYRVTTQRISVERTRPTRRSAAIVSDAVGATSVRITPSGEGTISFLHWEYQRGHITRERLHFGRHVQPIRMCCVAEAQRVHQLIQQARQDAEQRAKHGTS